jgi:hypothetical protein
MSVAEELLTGLRRVAARVGSGLTTWSGEAGRARDERDEHGRQGEQGEQDGQDGHLPTEDRSLFTPRVYGDPAKLHVAETAVVNDALFNLSSGEITVGEWAFFGHGVSVLTGTHDWRVFGAARQTAVPKTGNDVVVEEGVWVSSNATLVGPCRIGANAVVAVGAVVLGDVAPYTIVGGVPARVLREIPHDATEGGSDGSGRTPAEGGA